MQYEKDCGICNYGFMLNSKKYFVPNVPGNTYRIALELPDE